MNKSNAVQIRENRAAVKAFEDCGIDFIPMPVLSESDRNDLMIKMHDRIEKLCNLIEKPS